MKLPVDEFKTPIRDLVVVPNSPRYPTKIRLPSLLDIRSLQVATELVSLVQTRLPIMSILVTVALSLFFPIT